MKQNKRHSDYGFFDQDIRLSKLNQLGDPLQRLNRGIDFEIFRSLLEKYLIKASKGKGGRPPYDYVLMFKILILQRYYDPSDDQAAYQINDRMSFMRFLNLTIADDIPDSNTIWLFSEPLTDLHLVKSLFDLFQSQLEKLGLMLFCRSPPPTQQQGEQPTNKKRVREKVYGQMNPIKSVKRTLMHVGQSKIISIIMGIKITPRLMQVAN